MPFDRSFPCRTPIFIVLGNIAKVLLVKEALGFIIRCLGFEDQGRNTRALTADKLFTLEITSISNDGYVFCPECIARLRGHAEELIAIMANIGHLVGDDQMMFSVNGYLHVVAHPAGAAAAGGHGTGIWVGE